MVRSISSCLLGSPFVLPPLLHHGLSTKGSPYKVVSSLELLATVVSLMVFFPSGSKGKVDSGLVAVSGLTDSAVATHVLGKAMTTSYPLCLVAMEAAIQMEMRCMDLRLAWAPRELNQEADALSNFKFVGFSSEKRCPVDLPSLSFVVLGKMAGKARIFYLDERPAALKRKRDEQPRAAKPHEILREVDPW